MEKSPLIKTIEGAISPVAESMGYELVRVMLIGGGSSKPTLQIMAEDKDGKMGVDDCERFSKAVSAILDVEDIMGGAYFLEVSSPGIDRPLTRLKDFQKHKGFEARVEVEPAIEGRRKFKGKIIDVEADEVVLFQSEEGIVYGLPFQSIQRAKLTLTDDLLKSAQRKKAN